MKITILLGSPRKANTYRLAKTFETAAKAQGHEVHMIHIGQRDIHPCLGCDFCQSERGKGTCIQKDDMQEVYEAWKTSDMAVFATPVYFWNFTGQMQNMITRLYAMIDEPSPKKYALLITNREPDVCAGMTYAWQKIVHLFHGEDAGIFACNTEDQNRKETEAEIRKFAKKL